MKIFKPINNNIVSAYDEHGREIIVIGKGLGYKAKEGQNIPEEQIEKTFLLRSQNEIERLKELLSSLPNEYVAITDKIVTYAKKTLKKRIYEGAYITLADHINFAVLRFEQGMDFQNVLHTEVRRFYPEEYKVGLYALELMESRLGIKLIEDEAASIALHIFNAEYDILVSDAYNITKLLDKILNIVAADSNSIYSEEDYYYERFIIHLKYLAQRIVKKEEVPSGDIEFSEMVAKQYPREMICAEKIASFIRREYDYNLSLEEKTSLAIHIKRISI